MLETEQNKAIVRRFNKEVIEEGNVAAFHEFVSPDVINRTAPPGLPNTGEGMLHMIMNGLRPAFPDLVVEIQEMIAERDLVVTRKTFHGTHREAFMGIPPSNKKVSLPVIDIIRIKDGKYIEHWGMRDAQQLVAAAANKS
jgi:steroid delta-isomerase-like uncharacterized protein